MLRAGHALHAAGGDDVAFAGADLLRGERDRAKARAAKLVDAEGGLLVRHAAAASRLAGRVLALAGGEDLAEDQFVDVGRLNAGALERAFQRHDGHFVSRQRAQRAAEVADRGPGRRCNDDIFHDGLSSSPGDAPSGHIVQAAVNVNGVAGHARRGAAYQESYHAANLGDIHQTLRRGALLRHLDELVEMRDAARGAGLERPRRHGEHADAAGPSSAAM